MWTQISQSRSTLSPVSTNHLSRLRKDEWENKQHYVRLEMITSFFIPFGESLRTADGYSNNLLLRKERKGHKNRFEALTDEFILCTILWQQFDFLSPFWLLLFLWFWRSVSSIEIQFEKFSYNKKWKFSFKTKKLYECSSRHAKHRSFHYITFISDRVYFEALPLHV